LLSAQLKFNAAQVSAVISALLGWWLSHSVLILTQFLDLRSTKLKCARIFVNVSLLDDFNAFHLHQRVTLLSFRVMILLC
jgi:hypothetical protein